MNITNPLRCAPSTDRAVRPPAPALLPLLLLLLTSAPVPTRAADLFVETSPPGWTNWIAFTWGPEWGDYDNDGYLDVFMARSLTIDVTGAATNLVYHNNGDGSFSQRLAPEIGPIASDRDVSVDGCWADANNDGYLDLLVVNEVDIAAGMSLVPARLYMNRGNGTFTSVAAGALTRPHFAFGNGGWCDYDNDGWLDAFLCAAWGGNTHSTNVLVHGKGDGTFDLVTDNAIATERIARGSCSFGAFSLDGAWGDLDGDGDVDLLVANYCLGDFLYRNDGHGRFTRMTNNLLETDIIEATFTVMGDLDNDGDLDVAATGDGGTQVFLNQGDMNFVAGQELVPLAWPILLSDYDNDGDIDILGVAFRYQDGQVSLWRNDGKGTFQAVEEAFTRERARWAELSWADYDNDGFLDMIGGRQDGRNLLFRNQGNGNHWLKFRLVGTASNRSAIGAKIRVLTTADNPPVWQLREISSSDFPEDGLRAHFGLGDAPVAAEVRIEWPSGNVQTLTDVTADQILTVTEPVFFRPLQPVATLNGSVQITNTVVATARQWYFEGAPLEGQTGRVLALTNIQASQSGRYSVIAQTAAGPQTNHVYLRVLTQFTKILEGDIVTEEYGFNSLTWFDIDRDGWLDVYVPHDYDSRSVPSDSLFHNQRDGTFAKMPDGPLTLRVGSSIAGAAGDYDADGDLDIVVARGAGPAAPNWQLDLLRNDGASAFQLSSSLPAMASTDQPMDAAWADYDRDGDLDLLVAKGADQPQNDALLRNNLDGTFTAMTAEQAGNLVSDRSSTFMCGWIDYNGDGWPDALVQHFNGTMRLHRNNGNGTFSSVLAGSLTATRNDSGFSWGDYDNDGFPDLFAGMWDQGPARLHRNLAGTTFTNIVRAGDLTESKLGFRCQGVWGDYDNDGFLDLLVVGVNDPGALFRNRGDGTFQKVEVGNLVTDGIRRQPAVWVDYDNNGFLDLMVPCGDWVELPDILPQRCQLYRNNGNGNHWLKVKLTGTASNRDGIGAKVRVRTTLAGNSITQMREISGNSGFHGVPLLAHFGLGAATKAATVRIEWPSGIVQELSNVVSDQVLAVTEPALIKLTFARVAEGLRLEWRGEPNTFYRLQSSPALTAWGTSQYITTDATGTASVTVVPDATAWFFRVFKP